MKPESASPSLLDGRLVLYTTAGAGLLLTPGAAEAQTIVYSGVRNIIQSSGEVYNLDLNGDSVVDFSLQSTANTGSGFGTANSVASAGMTAFNRLVKAADIFVAPLTAGVAVGSASPDFGESGYLRK